MEYIARYDQADTGVLEIRTAAGAPTFGPLVQVFGRDRAEAALARWGYELTSGWREQADGMLAADVRQLRALTDEEAGDDLACATCGIRHTQDDTVSWRVDPYAAKINEDYRLYPLCDECEYESAMDVMES